MKHLRFMILFFLIVLLIVLFSPSSSGQSTQPSPQTPSLSPDSAQQPGDVFSSGKSHPASQASAAGSGNPSSQRRFKIKYLPPAPPKSFPNLLPDPPLVPGVSGKRVANLSDGAATEAKPEHSVDPGIFLRRAAGNFCGSIVSYNFSPGDNPQLESVTTCTPADGIVTRRALGIDKKPPAPLLRTTVLSMPRQ